MRFPSLPVLVALISAVTSGSAQTRYLDPVFSEVSVSHNVVYGRNATVLTASSLGEATPQDLLLDLYYPSSDTSVNRPVVIVVHDGMFLPPTVNSQCTGSKTDPAVTALCTRLAQMGYIAAAIDYRLGWNPVAVMQQDRLYTYVKAVYRASQDIRTAARFLRRSVAESGNPYGINAEKIVVWGNGSGGSACLAAATTTEFTEWLDPSLFIMPSPGVTLPCVLESDDGDIWATSVGINQIPNGLPIGDTLCYPNHTGYSSEFQLCVHARSAILTPNWLDLGEIPIISFHAPNDALMPCGTGTWTLPPIGLTVMPLSGSCFIQNTMQTLGNQQVFTDLALQDCISQHAFDNSGGLDGFFPFTGLAPTAPSPWDWTAPGSSKCNTDSLTAAAYRDTMIAFFAPRACAVLGICDPNAAGSVLCTAKISGIVSPHIP